MSGIRAQWDTHVSLPDPNLRRWSAQNTRLASPEPRTFAALVSVRFEPGKAPTLSASAAGGTGEDRTLLQGAWAQFVGMCLSQLWRIARDPERATAGSLPISMLARLTREMGCGFEPGSVTGCWHDEPQVCSATVGSVQRVPRHTPCYQVSTVGTEMTVGLRCGIPWPLGWVLLPPRDQSLMA